GGSDQLLGIGALLVLEASPERIRCICKYTGIGGKITAAVAASAAPNRFRLADHVTSPCYRLFLNSIEFHVTFRPKSSDPSLPPCWKIQPPETAWNAHAVSNRAG